MNEEQIKNLISQMLDEKLSKFDFSDRFIIYKTMQFLDGRKIQTGKTTGLYIGSATDQKIGFYNTLPIVQRSGSAQAAVATTASTQTTPWGYSTEAQANAIITLQNELRAWAVAQGFIKGSA